jgi:GTP-binding protein LepA
MCERLKDLISRHLFKIPIQAAPSPSSGQGSLGSGGGEGHRPRDDLGVAQGRDGEMLRRRHQGKKRMREYGSVSIPQEAFIAALRMGEEK